MLLLLFLRLMLGNPDNLLKEEGERSSVAKHAVAHKYSSNSSQSWEAV